MLDAVRYLVVWNPLILILLHYGLHYLGLERHIHHRAPHAAASGANSAALNGTGAAGLLAALGNGTGGAGAGLLGESGAAALANATLVGAIAQAAGGAGGGQAGVQR